MRHAASLGPSRPRVGADRSFPRQFNAPCLHLASFPTRDPFTTMNRPFLFILRAVIACGFALASTIAVAGTFSSLEERMSAAEFKGAGLDKLSPDELASLNAWLQAHAASLAAQEARGLRAPAEDRVGFDDAPGRHTVVSRIAGRFDGWNGGTRFELENGQVWQQDESASLTINPVENPVVTIDPAFMNTWRLRVDGYNQRVKVKRIK
jgi:hypothetical protein